ncbi:hypothetical protein HK405_010231, partial [Cladochytrium tenue]
TRNYEMPCSKLAARARAAATRAALQKQPQDLIFWAFIVVAVLLNIVAAFTGRCTLGVSLLAATAVFAVSSWTSPKLCTVGPCGILAIVVVALEARRDIETSKALAFLAVSLYNLWAASGPLSHRGSKSWPLNKMLTCSMQWIRKKISTITSEPNFRTARSALSEVLRTSTSTAALITTSVCFRTPRLVLSGAVRTSISTVAEIASMKLETVSTTVRASFSLLADSASVVKNSLKAKSPATAQQNAQPAPDPQAAEIQAITVPAPAADQAQSQQPCTRILPDCSIQKPFSLCQDLRLVRVLGKGGFGKVYRATGARFGRAVAIKFSIASDQASIAEQHRETDILTAVSAAGNPFILNFISTIETDELGVGIVLEYATCGSLANAIDRSQSLHPKLAQFYASEVLLGIEFLHSMDVGHFDLKPDNILVTQQGHLKISDFGLAVRGFSNNKLMKRIAGTVQYMAPEILVGKAYGKEVDLWAFGVILHEMLFKTHPFFGQSNFSEIYFPERSSPADTPTARSLLQSLLNQDLGQRLTDISAIKAHPYFHGTDFADVSTGTARLPTWEA